MADETRTIVSLRDYVDLRFEQLEKTHDLSCASIDKRLAGMNEFRNALKDQAAQMCTRVELQAAEDKLEIELRALREFKVALEAKASQQSVNLALLLSLAGLVLGVIQYIRP